MANQLSGSVSMTASSVKPTISEKMRQLIPKNKYCEKCSKSHMIIYKAPEPYEKFCSNCGEELDECVGELFITIDTEYRVPGYYENKPQINKDPAPVNLYSPNIKDRDTRIQITMKELVVLLKEYEKEMVIEGI